MGLMDFLNEQIEDRKLIAILLESGVEYCEGDLEYLALISEKEKVEAEANVLIGVLNFLNSM